jgi:putative ABC transport system permease protein
MGKLNMEHFFELLNFELILNIVELSCIYSLVVLGVFLTSQIIKFDDLTVDGSFATGAATTVTLLLLGIPAFLVIILSKTAGALTGMATGVLQSKLKLNNLISGIVVTTGLFSINLKMAGANATFGSTPTIFNMIPSLFFGWWNHIFILASISIGVLILIHFVLESEVGLLFKALGNNPQLLINLGKNINGYKIACLMLSNGIIALAGSLFVQHTGFFSMTGSIGTLGVALAGLIIGDIISNNLILKAFLGALFYQAIITATIEFQIDPVWNKLVTAILIVLLIIFKNKRE